MHNTVSLLALMVSTTLASAAWADVANPKDPLKNPEVAPAEPNLSVNFPDVQKQINADLNNIQQQAFNPPALAEPSPAEISAQPAQVAHIEPAPSAQGVSHTANMPSTAQNETNSQVVTMLPVASSEADPQTGLQPVAMVKMADGSIYPVYVAPGQTLNPNIQTGPEHAAAYLKVPQDKLPTPDSVHEYAQQIQTQHVQQAKGSDPAYSPQVKVFGNKTPTMIGSREEVRNHLNDLQQSGAYDYNVNASGDYYNQAANAYYNQYYNNYGTYGGYYPYYDPYYGNIGSISYYQDADGKWHKILGFRFDSSINNYVPIYAGYGSCVGPDCPVIYDPNYPNAGLPHPNPKPQGPAAGQPPAWGPPPSYQDPIEPGYTYPQYPGHGAYPGHPGSSVRPNYPPRPQRPVKPDPVDPGFTHPLS